MANLSSTRIFGDGTVERSLYVKQRLGVGVGSPDYAVDVFGDIRLNADGSSNGKAQVRFNEGSGTNAYIGYDGNNLSGGDNRLEFNSNGTHMVIENRGRVGMGTNSPGARLDVDGNMKLSSGGDEVIEFIATNNHCGINFRADGSENIVSFEHYTNGTDYLTVDYNNNGNVGIGTNSPNELLDLDGGTNDTKLNVRADDNTALALDSDTTNNARWLVQNLGASDGRLRFYDVDSNTEAGAFTSGGRLGVGGVTSPSYALDVNGTGNFSQSSSNRLVNLNQKNPASYNVDLNFEENGSRVWLLSARTNGNNDFWIYNGARNNADFVVSDSNGNVGIGTTGPDAGLNVEKSGDVVKISNSSGDADTWFHYGANGNNYLTGDESKGTGANIFRSWSSADGYIEHARVTPNGNVGIGTGSPSNDLDISTSGTDSGISFGGSLALTGTTGNGWLRLNQNNSFSNGIYTPGPIRADGNGSGQAAEFQDDVNMRNSNIDSVNQINFNSGAFIDEGTASYGSIRVGGGGEGNWAGINIQGNDDWVLMAKNNNEQAGFYNDDRNDWIWRSNGDEFEAFHNGSEKLRTTSDGINMNNNDIENVDQVEIDGAEGNTYEVRGGDNTTHGISVRSTNNPPVDRTMFAVESSGGSTRFGVTQNNGGFFRDKLWVESGSNTDSGEINSSDILSGSIRADNGMEIGDPNVGIFPDPFNSGILKLEAVNASGTDQIRVDASNNVFIEGRDKVIVGSGRGENHIVGPSYSNQGQETPPGTIFLGPGIRIETHFVSQQNGPTPQYTTFLIFNEEGSYDQRNNFFRDQLDDFYIRDILDRSEIALYSTVEGSFGGGGTGDTQIRYIEHQGDGNVDQGGVKD